MYAVIESGSKQYRVELGTEIQVDRLDVATGDSITLDRVLLVAAGDDTAIGQPVVKGASVSAEVLGQDRGDKIVVFKYKPKARHRVKKGFRAELTTLRISDIAFDGRSAAKDAEKAEAERSNAAKQAEQAATTKAAADVELAARLTAAAADADSTSASAKAPAAETPVQPEGPAPEETAPEETAEAAPEETAVEAAADEAPDDAATTSDAADAADAADDTQKDG